MTGIFADPPEGVTRWVAVVRPLYKAGSEPVRERPFEVIWKDAPTREDAEAFFDSDEGVEKLRAMFGGQDFLVEVVGETRDPTTSTAVFRALKGSGDSDQEGETPPEAF